MHNPPIESHLPPIQILRNLETLASTQKETTYWTLNDRNQFHYTGSEQQRLAELLRWKLRRAPNMTEYQALQIRDYVQKTLT